MNATASQQDFAAALQDPAQRVPKGLRMAAGVDLQRRFAVHRNNMVVGLVNSLASAFPVTQALVGETFFRAMVRERMRIDPPYSPILTNYGSGFASFIAGFAPAEEVPYLADIARLEHLRARAFHAADARSILLARLQTLIAEPDRLAATRLTLQPACGWLRSRYAVWSIWNAHQGLADLRDTDLGPIVIDKPESVLVTRPLWDVQVSLIPSDVIAALDALRCGRALGEAIAPGNGTDAVDLIPRFEALLLLIIQHGLVVELNPPSE